MDRLAIAAAEDFVHAGYPRDVDALLIVELDGPLPEVDHLIDRVERHRPRQWRQPGAGIDLGGGAAQILGRPQGSLSGGRADLAGLSLHGRHHSATEPAGHPPRHGGLSVKYHLACANVFHAGDGNLHPLILFDAGEEEELDRAEAFGAEILRLCVKMGGVLTGEHGVGVEKRDLMGDMFSEVDLAHQERLKCAFDAKGLLNPGKMFPVLHRCAELGRMHVHRGKLPFAEIPRF